MFYLSIILCDTISSHFVHLAVQNITYKTKFNISVPVVVFILCHPVYEQSVEKAWNSLRQQVVVMFVFSTGSV